MSRYCLQTLSTFTLNHFLLRNAGSCAIIARLEGWTVSGSTEEMCSLSSRRWPGCSSGASPASSTSASRPSSSSSRRSGAVKLSSGSGTSRALLGMEAPSSSSHSHSQFQLTLKTHQELAFMFTNPLSWCQEVLGRLFQSRYLCNNMPGNLLNWTRRRRKEIVICRKKFFCKSQTGIMHC